MPQAGEFPLILRLQLGQCSDRNHSFPDSRAAPDQSVVIACRVGKGALRGAGLLTRTVMRLCPRRPTSPLDRVGKVARGQRAMSSAAAGNFAHLTTLPFDGRRSNIRFSYRRNFRNVFFHAIVSISDFSASLSRTTLPSSARVKRTTVFSSSV